MSEDTKPPIPTSPGGNTFFTSGLPSASPAYSPAMGGHASPPKGKNTIKITAPKTPIGVLRFHVKEAKQSPKNANNIIFALIIDEQPFTGAEVAMFFNITKADDVKRLTRWCAILGAPIVGEDLDLDALKNKAARVALVPWHKNDGTAEASVAKFPPDEDTTSKYHSPEFHAWATANGFNYEALKNTGGILPL